MTRLSDNQRECLSALAEFGDWARPLDIGGSAGSHHSASLAGLCGRGLVERAARSAAYAANSRGSWIYRITDGGRAALKREHSVVAGEPIKRAW